MFYILALKIVSIFYDKIKKVLNIKGDIKSDDDKMRILFVSPPTNSVVKEILNTTTPL